MDSILKQYFDKMVVKILLLTMVCCVGIGFSLFYLHTSAQKEMLSTEISNRSAAIGNSIGFLLVKAVQLGIPFNEMVEMQTFLDGNIKKSQDIDYIVVTDTEGNTLYKSENAQNSLKGAFKRFALSSNDSGNAIKPFSILGYHNIPIKVESGKELYGYIHLGVSKQATNSRIDDIYYDIMTILFITMIAGFEFFMFIFRNQVKDSLMYFIFTMRRIINRDFTLLTYIRSKDSIGAATEKLNSLISSISSKYHEIKTSLEKVAGNNEQFLLLKESLKKINKSAQFSTSAAVQRERLTPIVENLRLPAFLMVLSETCLVAILPSYASQFYNPAWGFSSKFISSTPVLVFMIFSTIGVLLANKLSYKFGFRKSIIIGLYISILGYIGAFLTSGLSLMLASRALSAAGFGICYVNLQNYIAAYAPNNTKVQSYAIYAVAYGAAYVCGAPIGGILVDNIGFKYTFFIAALSSIISVLFVKRFIVDFHGLTLQKPRETKKKPLDLLKNLPFMMTIIFAGLPARLMFSSIIHLFFPLYLNSLGLSQSSVGRNLMIFGIVTFVFSVLTAQFVEKLKSKAPYILLASIFMIGISIFIPRFVPYDFAPELSLFIYALGSVIHTCAIMSTIEEFSIKEFDNFTKGTLLSYYFIAERIGLILGPVVVSNLLNLFGFDKTMIVLGSFMTICSLVYGVHYIMSDKFFDLKRNVGVKS